MSALNEHELYQAYLDHGRKAIAGQPPSAGRTLGRILMNEPAFQDPKHPSHAVVKADVKALYEAAVPNVPEPNTICVNGRIIDLNRDPVQQLGGAK